MRARSVLALIATSVPLVFGATAANARSEAPSAGEKRALKGNNFFANCRFSHTAADDPIVYPGQPGRSHEHTFFGNRSTDASSTPASLRGARTSCKPQTDKAAYWVPTLFQDGLEVRPAKGQFYYVLRSYDRMSPFPAGLKMIAGDQHAHHPQALSVVHWTCGGGAGVRTRSQATAPLTCPVLRVRYRVFAKKCPTCPRTRHEITARVKTFLELHVNYPDCWDGKRLDSPDHKSHMAHSRAFVCPASHPVKVPLIRALIRYPLTNGRNVALASGGQLTGHADFVNAWDQRALERLVDDCFHGRPCREKS